MPVPKVIFSLKNIKKKMKCDKHTCSEADLYYECIIRCVVRRRDDTRMSTN